MTEPSNDSLSFHVSTASKSYGERHTDSISTQLSANAAADSAEGTAPVENRVVHFALEQNADALRHHQDFQPAPGHFSTPQGIVNSEIKKNPTNHFRTGKSKFVPAAEHESEESGAEGSYAGYYIVESETTLDSYEEDDDDEDQTDQLYDDSEEETGDEESHRGSEEGTSNEELYGDSDEEPVDEECTDDPLAGEKGNEVQTTRPVVHDGASTDFIDDDLHHQGEPLTH